ncbi:MAG: hypothetical protein IKL46_00205 [Clostridia bacterium]|nr:hypothetical protein [Clostridia bacterium]
MTIKKKIKQTVITAAEITVNESGEVIPVNLDPVIIRGKNVTEKNARRLYMMNTPENAGKNIIVTSYKTEIVSAEMSLDEFLNYAKVVEI